MVKRFAKFLSLAFVVSCAASAQGVPPGLTPVEGTSRPLSHTAQSAPVRKDIPSIAKAANGAIVTIVTAANDKPIALGTGFLVSPDGVIVTNYHVIKTGNVAVVKFPDGTALPVDGVLASDKVRDLAIIKIHGKTFQSLTLGNSDRVQIGEDVVAIGNPLGLELTVSNGILSGNRTVEKEGGKFLQVTAPISHGSSGGPLFNMAGEVIGITSGFIEGGQNLNLAIPVNDAKLLLHNQSGALHDLPNEPEQSQVAEVPEVPEVPKAPTSHDDSMERGWCDRLAEKYTHYKISSRDWFRDYGAKYAFKIGYTNHYDASPWWSLSTTKTPECYVEIVIDYGPGENPAASGKNFGFSGQRYFIEDATFEGSGAPLFGAYSNGGTEGSCDIYRPSSIKCRSEEEFNELALRYFGIARPTAGMVVVPSPSGTAAANSHLPPNTKMSAAGLDSEKMTDEQVLEDVRYCNQYPNDSLQEPDGQQLRCRDLTAAMEMQLGARCKNGPDSKSEACKNMMAWFAALKKVRP
jgi:hypothetical protein